MRSKKKKWNWIEFSALCEAGAVHDRKTGKCSVFDMGGGELEIVIWMDFLFNYMVQDFAEIKKFYANWLKSSAYFWVRRINKENQNIKIAVMWVARIALVWCVLHGHWASKISNHNQTNFPSSFPLLVVFAMRHRTQYRHCRDKIRPM